MPDEIVHHHFTSNPAGRGQIHGLGRCPGPMPRSAFLYRRQRSLRDDDCYHSDQDGQLMLVHIGLLISPCLWLRSIQKRCPLIQRNPKGFNLHVENSEYPVTLGGEKLRREMGLSRKAGDGFDSRSWLSGW